MGFKSESFLIIFFSFHQSKYEFGESILFIFNNPEVLTLSTVFSIVMQSYEHKYLARSISVSK